MKKYIYILLIVVTMVSLTGCGNKERILTCEKKDKATGMNLIQTIHVNFKGDNILKVKMIQTINIEDSYTSYMEELKSAFESQFSKYNDKKGISLNTETKENQIQISVVADINTMDKETLESLEFVDTKESLENLKRDFEKQSYICQ